MAFIGEEDVDRWIAVQLRLSGQRARTLVDLITGYPEADYHKYTTGRTAYSNCRFRKIEAETTTNTLCDCDVLSNISRRILGTNSIEKPCFKADDIRKLFQFLEEVIGYYSMNQGECKGNNPGIRTDEANSVTIKNNMKIKLKPKNHTLRKYENILHESIPDENATASFSFIFRF